MRLQTFLTLTGVGVPVFAKRVGVTAAAVYRWLDGNRRPNAEQMRSIYRVTYGAVTPNDWVLGKATTEADA